jgi:membrane protein implicated in regulation of membrane protease activity
MQKRAESITDPADLMHLMGRFFLCLVGNVLLVYSLLQKSWVSVAVLSVVSLFLHRTTILLWKKLSQERLEKLAEREQRKAQRQ